MQIVAAIPMSRLSCSFCGHRNPEGSKFCNECGSPLHLVPCGYCEAVNHVDDSHCYRCGELLSPAPMEEMLPPAPTRSTTAAPEPASADPVSVAAPQDLGPAHDVVSETSSLSEPGRLAPSWSASPSRPNDVPADPAQGLRATPDVGSNDAGNADAIHVDGLQSPAYAGSRAVFPQRSTHRAGGLLLAVLFVAVGGAVYWSSLDTPRSSNRATTDAPPVTEQPIVAPALPASPPSQTAEPATNGVTPPAAPSAAIPVPESTQPTVQEPKSPEADAAPAPRDEATQPADAPVEARRAPSRSGGTSAKSRARPRGEAPRRSNPHVRTREEAERDAVATQRLIARDLGKSPPGDSTSAAPLGR